MQWPFQKNIAFGPRTPYTSCDARESKASLNCHVREMKEAKSRKKSVP
jgi:hypothetical protein